MIQLALVLLAIYYILREVLIMKVHQIQMADNVYTLTVFADDGFNRTTQDVEITVLMFLSLQNL